MRQQAAPSGPPPGWEARIQEGVEACCARRTELRAGLRVLQERRSLLAQDVASMAAAFDDDSAVEELSRGYCQLRVAQEEELLTLQQELCQAYSRQLGDLEAELCEREGELLELQRCTGEDPAVVQQLADLERRKRKFLEKQLTDRCNVWPWFEEQQAQLDLCKHLSEIYSEELVAASASVEALETESEMWRCRVLDEAAAATAAGGVVCGVYGALPVAAPSPTSQAGRLYAAALGNVLGRSAPPPMLLRRPLSAPFAGGT